MAFFNFNLLTDPPGDPLIDEDVYLNQNWDKLDSRLNQFQQIPNTIAATIPIGTEAFRTSGLVMVWTGSAWRNADSIPLGWSAWNLISIEPAAAVNRPGFELKYRVNTVCRKVELAGGLRATAASGPWVRGKILVTTTTGGIPAANKPVYDHIQQSATGIGTVAGQFASARIHIEANGTNSVKLFVSYQGDDIGGNFVMFDNVKWFY